jgi:DNA-directed RNA polymerase subunit beta'
MRTFHVGGTAQIKEESQIIAHASGIIKIVNKNVIEDSKKNKIIMGRNTQITIEDDEGRQIAIYKIPYGSKLYFDNNQKVEKNDKICEWDPYTAVIVSEINGKIIFNDIVEGVSYRVESDEQTGYKEKVIIDSRNKKISPSLTVGDRNYSIPVGAHLVIEEGDKVKAGEILVKIPRSAGSSGDITGGLPRVTEMFEARNPSNPAVVSEVDGYVSFDLIS